MMDGFVYLDEAVPGVFWDAKYATTDNFTGTVVDGYQANRIVGTCALAEALNKTIPSLVMTEYALLLWDGYRPQRAVDHFLRWAGAPEDGTTQASHYPNISKTDMVPLGYIAAQSGHSRGSTIDLTLCDRSNGQSIEMGGGFDFMDEQSHHGAQRLSPDAVRNRELLRSIMEQCGFVAYQKEWWHYSLKKEPYPDTYFNFPIG